MLNKLDIKGYRVIFNGEVYDGLHVCVSEGPNGDDYINVYGINSEGKLIIAYGHASDFKFVRIIDK